MEVLKFSKLTDEFVRVPTRGIDSGNDITPTGYAVSLAFVRGPRDPASGDWIAGSWETNANVTPSRYFAIAKATTLARGDYSIWVKITTINETVVRKVGTLRVE